MDIVIAIAAPVIAIVGLLMAFKIETTEFLDGRKTRRIIRR